MRHATRLPVATLPSRSAAGLWSTIGGYTGRAIMLGWACENPSPHANRLAAIYQIDNKENNRSICAAIGGVWRAEDEESENYIYAIALQN